MKTVFANETEKANYQRGMALMAYNVLLVQQEEAENKVKELTALLEDAKKKAETAREEASAHQQRHNLQPGQRTPHEEIRRLLGK